MDADAPRHVFVVLLRESAEARAAAHRLRSRISATASGDVVVAVPGDGLRGAAFLSPDPAMQQRAAAWWQASVGTAPAQVVCLVEHAPELPELAGFVAARLLVAVPASMTESPYRDDTVWEVRGDGSALADLALQAWADAPGTPPGSRLFSVDAPAAREPGGRAPMALAATGAPRVPWAGSTGRGRLRGPRTRRAPGGQAHAQWLLHPDYRGGVFIVSNPKGGPGKTTTAMGLALCLSSILEDARANGRVVLVDGNTRMSDTFRSMRVDPAAPTVRSLVGMLRSDPAAVPELQHANAGARCLAVLREDEDSGGYRLQEIEELARYLRRHFAAVVVDLVNDRPGTGSPTERLVQWWVTQANVVVIPVKASVNDFEGAERMLAGVGGLPAVGAYIRPPQRELDHHPRVRWHLERLRTQVRALHVIPEDHRVRTAALDNLNLTDAGSTIREAFTELAMGVLDVHAAEVARRLAGGVAWVPATASGPYGPLDAH